MHACMGSIFWSTVFIGCHTDSTASDASTPVVVVVIAVISVLLFIFLSSFIGLFLFWLRRRTISEPLGPEAPKGEF